MLKHLSQVLRPVSENPKFLVPISRIHDQKRPLISNPAIDFILDEIEDFQSSNPVKDPTQHVQETKVPLDSGSLSVRILHPWSEWDDLIGNLMKNGYFDGIGNPYQSGGIVDGKRCNQIRTASLNFARDRPGLMRYFTSKDIHVIVGYGCPSIDRKVVNSGKRLRAHIGIDEGNVCSSCILRGNCERAYVKARDNEGGRTVDVMRFLLTYSLDPITGSVESKPRSVKRLKEAIGRLLKQMVDHSMDEVDSYPSKEISPNWNPSIQGNSTPQQESRLTVPAPQGDWKCPKCMFLNFARNIKCMRCHGLLQERLGNSGDGQGHIQMKKGDWICKRCNFLNFAKNTRCLECNENPPKRRLNPGEWQCDSCNYINFKRNMVCLKCDHKRPKAFNS